MVVSPAGDDCSACTHGREVINGQIRDAIAQWMVSSLLRGSGRNCILVYVDRGQEASWRRCRGIERGRVSNLPRQDARAGPVVGKDCARAEKVLGAAVACVELATWGLRGPNREACAVRASAQRI